MLEPLDERSSGRRGVGRHGVRRPWGAVAAVGLFVVVMVALAKWAGRPGDSTGAGEPATTTSAPSTQSVERR